MHLKCLRWCFHPTFLYADTCFWGIFTANEKIELDLKKELRRLRHKIDVRYRLRSLKLRCSDACARKPGAVAADAHASSSP